MPNESSVVAIFETHQEAEQAVEELRNSNVDLAHVSIVGKDRDSEERVTAYSDPGDRMKHWGKLGAFWAGLSGLLLGGAFFVIPGVGHVSMAGPVVSWFVRALETAAAAGGLGALGAGLFSIGIPKNSAVRYETAIKAGKFLLIVRGSDDEVCRAHEALDHTHPADTGLHKAA